MHSEQRYSEPLTTTNDRVIVSKGSTIERSTTYLYYSLEYLQLNYKSVAGAAGRPNTREVTMHTGRKLLLRLRFAIDAGQKELINVPGLPMAW